MNRGFSFCCMGVLLTMCAAIADADRPDDTQYMETRLPSNPLFITSLTRLTACAISEPTDLGLLRPIYPDESKRHRETGKVILRLVLDSQVCVRKATIAKSSGWYHLDNASLEYVMNIRFPASMLSKVRIIDDGQMTLEFPIVWNLVPSKPIDPCFGGTWCADEAPPPPKAEEAGAPAEAGQIWMPGYYSHYAKTGYQWNEGQWGAARPGYHWIAPHWKQAGAKWVFVPGSWESGD